MLLIKNKITNYLLTKIKLVAPLSLATLPTSTFHLHPPHLNPICLTAFRFAVAVDSSSKTPLQNCLGGVFSSPGSRYNIARLKGRSRERLPFATNRPADYVLVLLGKWGPPHRGATYFN